MTEMVVPVRVRSPRHGSGRWVWAEGEPRPYHQYLYVRRTLDLPSEPASARLAIAASIGMPG